MSDKLNGNDSYPCVDCRRTKPVTLVQHATVNGRLCHWHICCGCYAKRERELEREGAAS